MCDGHDDHCGSVCGAGCGKCGNALKIAKDANAILVDKLDKANSLLGEASEGRATILFISVLGIFFPQNQ